MKNPLQYIARAAASLFNKVKATFVHSKKAETEIIRVDPFADKPPAPTRAEIRARWKTTHGKSGDKIARMATQKRITLRHITHAY